MSRATIREALITLERRRFVERVPRFGARVTKLGADDVAELFEVRAALLAIAAERCASVVDATVLARLRRLVEEMRGQGRADADPQRFAALSIEAQHLLLGASGNRYLLELYEQLASLSTWRLIRTRAWSFVQVARRRESARDWGSVVAALSAQDGPGAAQAARLVLEHSLRGVRAALAETPGGYLNRTHRVLPTSGDFEACGSSWDLIRYVGTETVRMIDASRRARCLRLPRLNLRPAWAIAATETA